MLAFGNALRTGPHVGTSSTEWPPTLIYSNSKDYGHAPAHHPIQLLNACLAHARPALPFCMFIPLDSMKYSISQRHGAMQNQSSFSAVHAGLL